MANTLTDLIPDLYSAVDIVSREAVGFSRAVALNATAEMAAKDEVIRVPVTQANASYDITPAATVPNNGDITINNVQMTINKSRGQMITWNGEQEKGYRNNGTFPSSFSQSIAQAMRTLVNEMEADIAALHAKASRAYGTAGTTPFASTIGDTAQARKILIDNGAPMTDLQMVIDTAAGANLRTLGQLTKANEAGSTDPLRNGTILDVNGFAIRESAQIVTSTAGTMSSATTTAAALTVGQTVIPLATAGTGVVAAGDIITIANDSNKYLVTSVSFAGANPASGDTITIAEPGLRVAQSSAAYAITVVAAAARNMAFDRNAIQALVRVPARPSRGDQAVALEFITDPISGITFSVAEYPGYHEASFEVGLAWGVELIKPEHCAILLG